MRRCRRARRHLACGKKLSIMLVRIHRKWYSKAHHIVVLNNPSISGCYSAISRRIVQHDKHPVAGEALWSLKIRKFRMEKERLAPRRLKLRKQRKGIS